MKTLEQLPSSSHICTKDDFIAAKRYLLDKLKSSDTKCYESYVDGISDYIATITEIIFED